MKEILPEKLKQLAKATNGKLYVVGGTCRDYLSGAVINKPDWDVCAPLPANKVVSAAESAGFDVLSVYGNTGTVKLRCGGEEYEFAAFRADSYFKGEHRPDCVTFTDDIRVDALRRDFKCNAVYYDICGEKFIDPLGGIEEIDKKIINTVDKPEKVFSQDGLRLMRLARQAAQTGFTPTRQCLAGARENSNLIKDIAPERIWAELNMILHADKKRSIKYAQYSGLKILCAINVFGEILPELAAGENMAQRSDYHKYDVLEHTLRCVMYADESIRLAALLHDAGKPYCKINTGKYSLHEVEGARIARDICRRLRVSNALTDECERLVKTHMYDINLNAGTNKIRKFIVENFDLFDKILLLKQADYSACCDKTDVAPTVKKWKEIYAEMKIKQIPFRLKELAINGTNLINAGISPNEVGKTLKALLLECVYEQVKNEKEALISRAKKINNIV